MKQINFTLLKNKTLKINKKNINVITDNQKLIFKIDNYKYKFSNNILNKYNEYESITLDFNNKKCLIKLLKEQYNLELNLEVLEVKNTDKYTIIKYKIETEQNIVNTIKIEYI